MEASDTLRSLLALSDRHATGRLAVDENKETVELYLLDGHLVATRAQDDAWRMVDHLTAAGHLSEERARQIRELTPEAMAILQKMGSDPIIGLLMKAVTEDQLAVALREQLESNVVRFIRANDTPVFEPEALPWVDNIHVGHDTMDLVCRVAGLSPEQARALMPPMEVDDTEVFDSGVFDLDNLTDAIEELDELEEVEDVEAYDAVEDDAPAEAVVAFDDSPALDSEDPALDDEDDLSDEGFQDDDEDETVHDDGSDEAAADAPNGAGLPSAPAVPPVEGPDMDDIGDVDTAVPARPPAPPMPEDVATDGRPDDPAPATHSDDDTVFDEDDDEPFDELDDDADATVEEAGYAARMRSALPTPAPSPAPAPEDTETPEPVRAPEPEPEPAPQSNATASAAGSDDALDDLDAFAGHDDDVRGGGADGVFVSETGHLDTVDLAEAEALASATEPTFAAPSLADDDAAEKMRVANETLARIALGFDSVRKGHGAESMQVLVDGRPREFGPLLHAIAVKRDGTLPAAALMRNVRERPNAEQRKLLRDGLLDLIARALDLAAEELDDDDLDAVLEETAGYRQRFGL